MLAKFPSSSTLKEAIEKVEYRITHSFSPREFKCLSVPVIDFDILKQYNEFLNRKIRSTDSRVNGQYVKYAGQSIQFRLDENGAVIKSEGSMMMRGAMSPDEPIDLIFDKPFLILLKKNGAKNPYFALWIANKELFSPVKD